MISNTLVTCRIIYCHFIMLSFLANLFLHHSRNDFLLDFLLLAYYNFILNIHTALILSEIQFNQNFIRNIQFIRTSFWILTLLELYSGNSFLLELHSRVSRILCWKIPFCLNFTLNVSFIRTSLWLLILLVLYCGLFISISFQIFCYYIILLNISNI